MARGGEGRRRCWPIDDGDGDEGVGGDGNQAVGMLEGMTVGDWQAGYCP